MRGEIPISGAKNAALPAMAMALLTPEACELGAIPDLFDIETLSEVMAHLGAQIRIDRGTLRVEVAELLRDEAPYDFVRKLRASVLLLGPLLARNGYARVSMPGGCAIGVRPVDQHLKAFEALGAKISLTDGYIEASAKKLVGTRFAFDVVTVTGTINAMMAATAAQGTTILENCAREPEVAYCAELLAMMGVDIRGAGSSTIELRGRQGLRGFASTLIPDRIETGTYMIAGAITEGDIRLKGARAKDLAALNGAMRAVGVEIDEAPDSIQVRGRRPFSPIEIVTAPHPGFPTDMQAQLMSLLCLAKGQSKITETIFENRYMHVPELARMGARVRVAGSVATIEGVERFVGAPVMATDLRASASLVLAGLAAQGVTTVSRIYHLDRGYEAMERKLSAVGAKIERVGNRGNA